MRKLSWLLSAVLLFPMVVPVDAQSESPVSMRGIAAGLSYDEVAKRVEGLGFSAVAAANGSVGWEGTCTSPAVLLIIPTFSVKIVHEAYSDIQTYSSPEIEIDCVDNFIDFYFRNENIYGIAKFRNKTLVQHEYKCAFFRGCDLTNEEISSIFRNRKSLPAFQADTISSLKSKNFNGEVIYISNKTISIYSGEFIRIRDAKNPIFD